jgi:hypothetical protein
MTSMKEHTDFELEQFVHDLYHEVNSLAFSDADGSSKEEKFTEHIMSILAEAGETEGVKLCTFAKENRFENIELKINGYAIEDGYESIDLFVTQYVDLNKIFELKTAEYKNLVNWGMKFLNVTLKGYENEIDPANEAHALASIIRKYRDDLVRVNIFLLSNGNIPFDAPKKNEIKGFEDLQINIHIWDLERIHRLSQSKYNREPIEIDFKETLGVTIPCLAMPSDHELYECYLAIVPGYTLATLYRNYGTRLLESNVRAFLQQTGKVNKGIRDTIKEEPHMFFPYNNGLATTAMDVRTEIIDDKLSMTAVKDFQIVNGGQTTASLFHTLKKFKADLSKVFVQMKLTVIKNEDKKNEIVPFISRYANSQNKVSELDLTSNNPFLKRLEELSQTTYAIDPLDYNKQTIWFFERVTGQYREALGKEPTRGRQENFKLKYPINQKITKSEVAKYMNVFRCMPHHVAKGAQKNYTKYLDDVKIEFKKNKPSSVFWEDVVANAILFQTANKLFGRKDVDAIGDTNVRSQTVAYGLSLLHYFTKGKIDFGTIWNKQQVDEFLQNEIKKGLIFVNDFFLTYKGSLISEVAKDEKTWHKLLECANFPFDQEILERFTISDAEHKRRYESREDDLEERKKYVDLQKLTDLGIRFWDGLNLYMLRTNILSQTQQNAASSIRGKLLRSGEFTDHEINKGIELLNVLREENVDFEEVSKLSRLQDRDIIDPSLLYDRFAKLEKTDWDKIIQLGEQTSTLNFNEISVIKTVIQKLKRKETIDLKRLQIIEEGIKKLRRFGIKY